MVETPQLTHRLKAITRLIPQDCAVADIGTDHALVPTALAITKQARKIIAADCQLGPLVSARATLAKFGCIDQVELRHASGFAAFSLGEVDTVILAGMGAHTIVKILTEDQPKLASLSTIVVQANRGWELVRACMHQYGFAIADECLVADGRHIYVVIQFRRSHALPAHGLSPADLWIGPKIRNCVNWELYQFLCIELKRSQNILKSLIGAGIGQQNKLDHLETKQTLLQAELERWHACTKSPKSVVI